MEGEKNTDMGKIDIAVTKTDVKANQMGTATHGEESWIVEVHNIYKSGNYKNRKTSQDASICRVPVSIRSSKPKAYDPLVLSLGPYHHKKELSAKDEYKLQAVEATLGRIEGMAMDKLFTEVGKMEEDIRVFYEDSAIQWKGDTLVKMMTMDACFILEFLRKGLPNSILVFDNVKRTEVLLDILKLENQIPLCILIKILQFEFQNANEAQKVLAELLIECRYFTGFPFKQTSGEKEKRKTEIDQEQSDQRPREIIEKLIIEKCPHHLLDLCRCVIAEFLTGSGSGSCSAGTAAFSTANSSASSASANYDNRNGDACSRWPSCQGVLPYLFKSTVLTEMPSAEKLRRAGIKCGANSKVHFKQRTLGRGTLFVYQITVDHSTEIFLRNLMAFEQCQMGRNSFPRTISAFVRFMDDLIDTKGDVAMLVKQNIIINYLGSEEEVATTFNDLCRGIIISHENDEFEAVLKPVNKHYNMQLNVWRRRLKVDYFSTPFYAVSFAAAVLLLLMSAVQTVFSIIK